MTGAKSAEAGLGGVLAVALVFGIGQQFAGGMAVTCPGVRTCVAPGATDLVAWVPVVATVLVAVVAVALSFIGLVGGFGLWEIEGDEA